MFYLLDIKKNDYVRIIRWMIVVGFVLLSGCASLTKSPVGLTHVEKQAHWQQALLYQSRIKQWGFSGRLGLRVPRHSGSLSLVWQQNYGAYTLALGGPFGQSIAKIQGGKFGVTAELSNNDKPVVGSNPEAVMRRITGWDLPVENLQYWVRGIPVPNVKADVTLNAEGVADKLIQQGWTISYANYQKVKGGLFPTRLKVSRQSISMVLSVSQWVL